MSQVELITPKELQETFGKRLRALRKERCGTQQEAAEALDVPRTYFSDYERGRTLPRLDTLLHIADSWGVPADWLVLPEARRDLTARPDDELLAWFVRVDQGLARLVGERSQAGGTEPPWTQQEHFGTRLRRARLARGMTQGEVARAVGAQRVLVSLYEVRGRMPHLPRLAQLSQLLGTTIEALVRDEPKWPELHLAAPEAALYRRARETSPECREVMIDLLERLGERLWQRVETGPPVGAPEALPDEVGQLPPA